VLLPSASVARRDLQVAVLERTDPDVCPRGRDHERAESLDRVLFLNGLAVCADVRKAAAVTQPLDAGHRVADVAKPGGFCGIDVLSGKSLTHRDSGFERLQNDLETCSNATRQVHSSVHARANALPLAHRPPGSRPNLATLGGT